MVFRSPSGQGPWGTQTSPQGSRSQNVSSALLCSSAGQNAAPHGNTVNLLGLGEPYGSLQPGTPGPADDLPLLSTVKSVGSSTMQG